MVMDTPMLDAPPLDATRPALIGLPYAAKWDLLQPYIARLFFEDRRSLADIQQTVRNGFGFNAEYQIMLSLRAKQRLYPSPPASIPASLTDLAVSPTNSPVLPVQSLSPLIQVQSQIKGIQRAQLFVEGRHAELMKSMNQAEQEKLSLWLYQCWFFAFKTAKYWGRGPRD